MVAAHPETIHRWTYDQFMAIAKSGLFKDGPHVELIDGVITDKMGQEFVHKYSLGTLLSALQVVFGSERFFYSQSTYRLSAKDAPEPDVIVFKGTYSDYRTGDPAIGEVLLIVEVANTSVADDLTRKRAMYARAGIPEYWIVDVNRRGVWVLREPRSHEATWEQESFLPEGEAILPLHAPEGAEPIPISRFLAAPGA